MNLELTHLIPTQGGALPQAQELLELMETISEDVYCAGWMDGIEYRLWDLITDSPRIWDLITDSPRNILTTNDVSHENIEELVRLSNEADGWWYWDEEVSAPTFISLEKWTIMIAETPDSLVEKAFGRATPRPGEIWRHFRGNIYGIIAVGRFINAESNNTAYGISVLYEDVAEDISAPSKRYFIRSMENFMGEVKYKHLANQWRFTKEGGGNAHV